MTSVGIIANPRAGKDIRRLVAHGSVLDTQEKVYIVRRAIAVSMAGADGSGVFTRSGWDGASAFRYYRTSTHQAPISRDVGV